MAIWQEATKARWGLREAASSSLPQVASYLVASHQVASYLSTTILVVGIIIEKADFSETISDRSFKLDSKVSDWLF